MSSSELIEESGSIESSYFTQLREYPYLNQLRESSFFTQLSLFLNKSLDVIRNSREVFSKWAYYDEKRKKGNLAGKVFTGTYALIFISFFLYSCYAFSDILIPYKISWTNYVFHYGSFLLCVLSTGIIGGFLICLLIFESFSELKSTRWPLDYGIYFVSTLFISCNMTSEPYATLKLDWFGSDLRYPEFMNNPGFFMKLTYFLLDMKSGFINIDENNTWIHFYRPWLPENSKDKQRLFNENLTGLLSLMFIYMSYWYFIFDISKTYEYLAYYLGIYFLSRQFSRAYNFEMARKSHGFYLYYVPALSALQFYHSYTNWQSYNFSNFTLLTRSTLLLLHLLIFVGWNCNQNSLLGDIFLPYKIKPEFEGFDFDANIAEAQEELLQEKEEEDYYEEEED